MITLEYANMGDLKTYIPHDNLEFLLQLFQGVKYLHDNLILHMDIKPANILIKNHIPKIADFDASVKLESKNDRILMIGGGTPNFSAPEVLLHKFRGLKCDIWSLGMTFYYVLTRKNLIRTDIRVYFRHKTSVTIPQNIEFYDVLNKMIAVNPYYRYSIDELIDNVEKENFEEQKNSLQDYEFKALLLDGLIFFNKSLKQGTLVIVNGLFYEVNFCEELIESDRKISIQILKSWENVYIIHHH